MKQSLKRLDYFAFFWALFVLLTTYAMRSLKGVEYFFISGIFNWSEDTLLMLGIRWSLWLSVPFVLFSSLCRRVGVSFSLISLIVWWVTVLSGVQLAVFGEPIDHELQSRLRYGHYAASGLMMVLAGSLFFRLGLRRHAWSWIIISILYCTIFLINHFYEAFTIPKAFFKTIEYLFYGTFLFYFLINRPVTEGESIVTR